jgi:lysophospholipase L1-like esterase
MRGATDRDDRTIPSALARALNGEGRSPLHFIVTNFGVNSFNSLLETQYLQKLLEEGQGPPDVIVFYDGANDAKYLAECRTPYGHHGYRKVQGIIESYYRSGVGLLKPLVAAVYASFSWELYDKFQQVAVPLDPASPLVREMVEATERRYDYVDRLAMCHGARFLLIWQPMLWVEGCSQRGTHGETDASAVGRAARWSAVAENFSVPYHALLERLQGKPYFSSFRDVLCDPSGPVYQPDGVHLTDEGRERVAWRIAELLMETAFGPP